MARYEIKQTNALIDSQMDTAAAWENKGTTAVPGMTYEQGVQAGLRWIIGEEKELPIEAEPEEE